MPDAVADLVRLLDLEVIEVNLFRGISPDIDLQRVFGGQVAGQALIAAARTVDDDRQVHSLHAYFLRPGDPIVPILYESIASATGVPSRPGGWWPSSTDGRSSTCRRRSTSRSPASTTRSTTSGR